MKKFFRFIFVYMPLNHYQAYANTSSIFRFHVRNLVRRTLILTLFSLVVFTTARITHYFFPRTVQGAPVEVIKEVKAHAPVLDRIFKCESNGKHTSPNGQVILNANNNGSVDIGIAQINERLWGKKATELGYNLFIEADNRAFAQYLYENYGTEPWVWSKACWNK